MWKLTSSEISDYFGEIGKSAVDFTLAQTINRLVYIYNMQSRLLTEKNLKEKDPCFKAVKKQFPSERISRAPLVYDKVGDKIHFLSDGIIIWRGLYTRRKLVWNSTSLKNSCLNYILAFGGKSPGWIVVKLSTQKLDIFWGIEHFFSYGL